MSFWMANSLKGSTCGCCMSTMASLWWPWAAMKRRMEQLLGFTPSSDPRVIFGCYLSYYKGWRSRELRIKSGVRGCGKNDTPVCEAIEPLEKGLSRCRYCNSIGWIFRVSFCWALDVWLLELLEPTCEALVKMSGMQQCHTARMP